jgi:magnesium chelatase family protein
MLSQVNSGAVFGIDAYPVEIEVNAGHGEPKVVIVGLPDAAVKESSDRVWTALINSGFRPPLGRTTINLAPADMKKEGPSFDLPIALGIIAALEDIKDDLLPRICIVGELALSGAVRRVRGVLPIAIMARDAGIKAIVVFNRVGLACGYLFFFEDDFDLGFSDSSPDSAPDFSPDFSPDF